MHLESGLTEHTAAAAHESTRGGGGRGGKAATCLEYSETAAVTRLPTSWVSSNPVKKMPLNRPIEAWRGWPSEAAWPTEMSVMYCPCATQSSAEPTPTSSEAG